MNLCRAGNLDNPRFLGEQPSERDLGARRALARGDRPQKLNEGEVGIARRLGETRDDVAEIVLGERSLVVDGAGQEALA